MNEFEAILAEHQAKGLEDQALEADVLKKTKAAKKRAAKRGGTRTVPREADEDGDEGYGEKEDSVSPAKPTRGTRAKGNVKKPPPRRGE